MLYNYLISAQTNQSKYSFYRFRIMKLKFLFKVTSYHFFLFGVVKGIHCVLIWMTTFKNNALCKMLPKPFLLPKTLIHFTKSSTFLTFQSATVPRLWSLMYIQYLFLTSSKSTLKQIINELLSCRNCGAIHMESFNAIILGTNSL